MKNRIVALMLVVGVLAPATAEAVEQPAVSLPRMSERRKYQLGAKFIERLAWCETHGNWTDRGNWAGGLGIARSTWIAFGGRQFASTPDRASKEHQIVVANRIALWGFTRRDGRFVFPVGLSGWGALPCAVPVRIVPRRIPSSLAFSAHETGDPYAGTGTG